MECPSLSHSNVSLSLESVSQSHGPATSRLGNDRKVEGQERLSDHFFPCNAIIGLMLDFAKVGRTDAPFALVVPGTLVTSDLDNKHDQ